MANETPLGDDVNGGSGDGGSPPSLKPGLPPEGHLLLKSDFLGLISDLQETIPRRKTLPELLAMREECGMRVRGSSRSVVGTPRLAYRGAWTTSRMNNMILAIGPNTPASVVAIEKQREKSVKERRERAEAHRLQSSSNVNDVSGDNLSGAGSNGDELMNGSDGDDSSEQEIMDFQSFIGSAQDDNVSNDNSEDDGDDDDDIVDDEDDDDDSDEQSDDGFDFMPININRSIDNVSTDFSPTFSMKHGGCINTATWLDCGWRLSSISDKSSLSSHNSPYYSTLSNDCPTQLMTSGDDHLVKFWDARHSMGSASPWSGGADTICPFSSPTFTRDDMVNVRKRWHNRSVKSWYHSEVPLPGTVLPLATLNTGHSGNVFHVTPIRGRLGEVATCAADGFLRISNLETGNSTAVISPEFDGNVSRRHFMGFMATRPGMCFSHHFLTEHTGLICTERGLRRFDTRLAPREQQTTSLIELESEICKACAVYSSTSSQGGAGDSAYAFAGGTGGCVSLFDLRVIGSGSSRKIQNYLPSDISKESPSVSVSGLDLSRDKQELLVSYESDVVYTFPVFPNSKPAGPSLEDIDRMHDSLDSESEYPLRNTEIAAYGGHLNRLTFLKNAKFAGPRDEYICTGSDSGHAWIYEKATGAVVSFLNADTSTCNGVIPHPELPFFITYGIASTALLWRATIPVDDKVDDSPNGRALFARDHSTYEMSSVTKSWSKIEKEMTHSSLEIEAGRVDVYPDQITPETRNMSKLVPIGNNLINLPKVLQRNIYEVMQSAIFEHDALVASGPEKMERRVSLIRLRHHADRLGLRWNPMVPWVFHRKQGFETKENGDVDSDLEFPTVADLVPDYPSDIFSRLHTFDEYFQVREYKNLPWRRYLNLDDGVTPYEREDWHLPWLDEESWKRGKSDILNRLRDRGMLFLGDDTDDQNNIPDLTEDTEASSPSTDDAKQVSFSSEEEKNSSGEESGPDESTVAGLVSNENPLMTSEAERFDSEEMETICNASHIEEFNPEGLVETVEIAIQTMIVLKNRGNVALQHAAKHQELSKSFLFRAATYYDKAIQYGASVVLLKSVFLRNLSDFLFEWGDLTKTLLATRLNLALLFLKPEFDGKVQQAAEQARIALAHLEPFCKKKGNIVPKTSCNADSTRKTKDEPESTYEEAVTLQIKAYFRLGSAYLQLGNYSIAVDILEKCIESSAKLGLQPDKLTQRRLLEAKRQSQSETKRQRNKLQRAFGGFGNPEHQRKKSSPSNSNS